MAVSKAVVPVAGLGTRLLPATKAIPKEMLPVGGRPIIQYVVDELAAAGVKQILFVTSSSKSAIENHFDDYPRTIDGESKGLLDHFDYHDRGLEFFFTRQQIPAGHSKPRGTGDAIAHAETFVDGAPFLVAYGDSIVLSEESPNLLERLAASHSANSSTCTVAVQVVPTEKVSRYGIVVPLKTGTTDQDFELADIVEKPDPAAVQSRLAVSARYILGPEIFDELRALRSAAETETSQKQPELYITDGIRQLIRNHGMVRAVQMSPAERRFDIGNHSAYYETFIEFALADPECGQNLTAKLLNRLSSVEK